jgi:cytochrome c oxidase cbb3-type subunit 3
VPGLVGRAIVLISALLVPPATVFLRAGQPPSSPPPSALDVPRFGIVEYPQRAPGDPRAVEQGRTLYGVHCRFCHGADLRGGDGGGPNLLRSATVLDDDKGERIGPLLRSGRGAMPRFDLTDDEMGAVAAYLHSFPVTSRFLPSDIDIVVGDAKAGERYVTDACGRCHTTASLSAFANDPRVKDPIVMQQMWLMPGFVGRFAQPPIPPPLVRVAVTPASGARVEGTLVRMDDFSVSLRQADGTYRTFRAAGGRTAVEVIDPLAPHKALLGEYRDADIHNVTAYLMSLRETR